MTDGITESEKALVAQRWSELGSDSDAFSDKVYWLALPPVMARYQQKACGGFPFPSWVEYCLSTFMTHAAPHRMLSIGCGFGSLERHLWRLNAFDSCDAFDVAPKAIESASAAARAEGCRGIRYACADVETLDLEPSTYDAVWFNGSLHHIAALDAVLQRVRRALKPNGFLFANEYVGANHFGFPRAQKLAIAHAFHLIPQQYRRSFIPATFGSVSVDAPIPDPDEVRRSDPSEAVKSEEIMSSIERYFDIAVANPCGGTLLQFLLSGIAGNFREDDASSLRILDMLFAIEDALIATGALSSDFMVVAARPRSGIVASA